MMCHTFPTFSKPVRLLVHNNQERRLEYNRIQNFRFQRQNEHFSSSIRKLYFREKNRDISDRVLKICEFLNVNVNMCVYALDFQLFKLP